MIKKYLKVLMTKKKTKILIIIKTFYLEKSQKVTKLLEEKNPNIQTKQINAY